MKIIKNGIHRRVSFMWCWDTGMSKWMLRCSLLLSKLTTVQAVLLLPWRRKPTDQILRKTMTKSKSSPLHTPHRRLCTDAFQKACGNCCGQRAICKSVPSQMLAGPSTLFVLSCVLSLCTVQSPLTFLTSSSISPGSTASSLGDNVSSIYMCWNLPSPSRLNIKPFSSPAFQHPPSL